MGRLPDNLRAIGVAPESIEIILLTHLHPDHSNGLIDREGRPVFPNAQLILHEREAAFWLKREAGEGDNERVRRNLVASKRATAPYRLRAVADGEALPGITAVLQPGHTPGHTCWLISGGGRRLLIWGDIVHLPKIQVPRPEAALVFDVDPVEAPRTRSRVLDWVSREQLPVGGAHLDAPGFGLFSRNGARYAYAPLT
jgi:glyoxylase-like metal-dependent hydrolase (beta-lactamase superfamily II)